MVTKPKLFRSLLGRFSIGIALVTVATVLGLYLLADRIVRDETNQQIAMSVDTDIAGLADIYASGGQTELVSRLKDRIEMKSIGQSSDHYLLADGAGVPIIGNMDAWPELSSENSEAGFVRLSEGLEIYARATQLGPDIKLLVGWDTSHRDELLAQLRLAFLVATVAIVILVLLLGWWATGRLRTRLESINYAFRNIGHGEFDSKIVVDGRGDELDELSARANEMVSRISNLITAHRDISDHTAHELRTPLMHLDNRLVAAMAEISEPEKQTGLIQARSEIKKITTMLDSLLDIASSKARKGDRTGLTEINLTKIAREMSELFAQSAEDIGVDFAIDIEENVKMLGDQAQMQRIISNLLDNAFKYTPHGGKVTLTVSNGPIIKVRDNGPGIPDDMREKIFNRFMRLNSAEVSGHGLGLALSKALAERNGLEIICRDGDPGALFEVKPEGAE